MVAAVAVEVGAVAEAVLTIQAGVRSVVDQENARMLNHLTILNCTAKGTRNVDRAVEQDSLITYLDLVTLVVRIATKRLAKTLATVYADSVMAQVNAQAVMAWAINNHFREANYAL